jgi:hypothetical protein
MNAREGDFEIPGEQAGSVEHHFLPRARVLVYQRTTNIGDAIQTVALARLLGGVCAGIYRDSPLPDLHRSVPFVVNGWLGHSAPSDSRNCVFAGVHLGHREPEFIRWMRNSGTLIGARDRYTRGLLTSHRVPAQMIGCATLTLPRYRGPRKGRYSIDVEPVSGIRSETSIIADIPWADQWDLALHRLEQFRTAEVVYTRRLHVALPCLAFGTPVVFPSSEFRNLFDKSRLDILHDMGFVYDEPVEMDVSAMAEGFIQFLEEALNEPIRPVDRPEMPIPIVPPAAGNPFPAMESKPVLPAWNIPQEGVAGIDAAIPGHGELLQASQSGVSEQAGVDELCIHQPRTLRTRGQGPLASVSAVVLSRDGESRLERCLESIAHYNCGEIVVCVDRMTTDHTMRIARRFTGQVHLVQTAGYIERSLMEMASLCSKEFILRIDDDEALGGDWDREPIHWTAGFNDVTHFFVPRRWIAPPGDRFIADPPWFPDLQMRLFRNDPSLITWPVEIHDMTTVKGRGLIRTDRWIDHYDLLIRSREEREEKCRRYRTVRPAKHLSHFYLWEDSAVQLVPTDASGFAHAVERALSPLEPKSIQLLADYEPGSEIRFHDGGNAERYQAGDWSRAEPWGTWTDGHHVVLNVPIKQPVSTAIELTVVARAYVRPKHPIVRIFVVCGRTVIAEWEIDSPEAQERTLTIPQATVAQCVPFNVAFFVVNPASPKELEESDDARLLGLGFCSVRLR